MFFLSEVSVGVAVKVDPNVLGYTTLYYFTSYCVD